MHLEEKLLPLLKEIGKTSDKKQIRNDDSLKVPVVRELDKVNKQISQHEKNIRHLPSTQEVLIAKASSLKSIESYLKKVDFLEDKLIEVENSVLNLNQSQMEIYHRLEQIEHNLSLLQNQEQQESEEQTVVIKEIHIDKFYLDKYEQNNNFGQLGIKSLSGALNIGATYGRDTIPKKFTDQIKEDMDEIKGIKEEFNSEKDMGDENESNEESSSSSETILNEEDFTEIPIDFWSEEESGD